VQPKHLNILEFPKVLERLAGYTAFSASKTLALNLQPSPYLAEARGWQAETTEANRMLSVKVNISVGGSRDVRPYLVRARQGFVLIVQELLEIRQTLTAARQLQRTIIRMADSYPRLADIAQRIEECPGVVNAIGQSLDDNGAVRDNASPTLSRIRKEIDVAHGRLMEKLNRIISSGQHGHYLQEALVTQRAGRYVIPLKAEFKGRIQGVVHDQSASGATLFIEPLATVELNNKWRQLQLDEEDEIRRILAALSALVGSQADFISHTVAALAELDLAFAKAKYAQAIAAVEPILADFPKQPTAARPPFRLSAGRHPLLDPRSVVPIDVWLDESTSMLVITGPNTGGKTVSLKTIGLLAAMAQAGLWIPAAEGSTLPVFNQIFADIGDEQSIEQSLSTFSAHMTNVVHILTGCDRRSLVIFDELGAGTDPIEGSALARSILSNLLERGVTTFIATHYSELKAFAHATPGVSNASMEFDLQSLAPTYKLRIGLPGASNAFTIAQRLGLPQEIINAARGLVGEDAQQIEAMLAEIKAQNQAAYQARQAAEAKQAEAEDYMRQLQQQLDNVEVERQEILNSARADARREIKAARKKIRALQEQAQEEIKKLKELAIEQSSPAIEAVDAQLETLEGAMVAEKLPQPAKLIEAAKSAPIGPIRPGDRVFVSQFATTAEVLSIHNNQVEIQLGRFRATVPLAELQLQARAPAVESEQQPLPRQITTPEVESPGMELDLRGQVVEEALINLDQYLDRAYLARLPSVRIIHGKGSGILRQMVREELSQHPLVSSYRAGLENEGGDGVTIAKLAVS
jgi:DNA mismatch repair protein MutS2